MHAVVIIRPSPKTRGYYDLVLSNGEPPKVACSESEASSRAVHLVSRNGGTVWLLDAMGYPQFSETIPAQRRHRQPHRKRPGQRPNVSWREIAN